MAVGTVSISTQAYGPAVSLVTDLNDRNDSTKTGKYKIRHYTISTPEPERAYHVPDEGEERLVRIEDGERLAEFVMTIYGSDRDALDSNINDLRGILKEASRHELDDAFSLYYLTTQPAGATNATYHDIKAGWIDDSQSHWTAVGEQNNIAYEAVCYIILRPYGYRDAITLENFLASSPHFLEDSDADGLADGWNKRTAGTTVTALSIVDALIGHSSQLVTVTSGASDQGIVSDSVTANGGVNGFAWVCFQSSLTDPIRVRLLNDADTVLGSVTISPGDPGGVADYSIVSKVGGKTWYRVGVSGDTNNNAKLEIIRHADNAADSGSFNVDGCYLNTGGLVVPPDGWISSRRTENNYSLDTEADINYCDVWGIPGDAQAVAIWKLTAQSVGLGFFMGRMTDGKARASEQTHWLDSADGTGTTGAGGNGVWSTNNNAAWAGDSAALFTEGSTNNGGYLSFTVSGNEARALARTPRRVIALMQSATTDLTVLLGVYGDSGNVDFASHNTAVSPAVTSVPTLLNLGTINLLGVLPDDVPDTDEPDIEIRITLDGLTSTETAYIDALFMLPVKDDYMVYHILEGNGFGANELWINGHTHQVIAEDRGFDRHFWQGSMWTLEPGQVMNRLVFMTFANTTQFTYDLAAGFNWKLEVTPRGRHLLGSR